MKTYDINTFRDLEVYQLAFSFQQSIFRMSQGFPREETFSLTDQVRRSSRAIGANIAESWAKRRYPAHFLSKLTDADGELQESSHWLATAHDCGYLAPEQVEALFSICTGIGGKLGGMMAKHEKFCLR